MKLQNNLKYADEDGGDIEHPLVSIVILNWNGEKCIRDCLDSVLRTEYPSFEVIVVDNASTDGSKDLIKNLYPQVKLIENRENLGWCIGNNIGIKEAKGDIIVLLNNDTIVDKNWIKEIVNEARNPDVGVIGCRLYFPNTNVIQSFGFRKISLEIYENIGGGQVDNGQLNDIRDVDYVSGAAMAIKMEVLEKVGLLDPNLNAFHTDVDLCLRAKKAGYRVVMSNAKVYHYGSFSWNKFPIRKILFFHKDRLYFIRKHYAPRILLQYLLLEQLKEFKYNLIRYLKKETVLQRLNSLGLEKEGKKLIKSAIEIVLLNYTLFIVALFAYMFRGRKLKRRLVEFRDVI
ncbi:MAG: glycosyltransferase family 2 protein [Candidatus Bathyarchaeia archaeon]